MPGESKPVQLYEDVPIPHFCQICNKFAIIPPVCTNAYDSTVNCSNCGEIFRWGDIDPKIPDPSW